MQFDAEFYVGLGFVLFVLILGYYGTHTRIAQALDGRTASVENELAEARRLREEAAAVLASFERKRAEAQAEAEAIVAQARAEADTLGRTAQTRMVDFVARRTKQAEAKIALAEAQATADVRAAAADAAVHAAETVLRASLKGETADRLLSRDIAGIRGALN